MENNYRIHTNILSDTVLNVNMKQDYDFLELLTLKLRQKDAYRLHSSNYGVIIGRVLANDAFGIPNARISVFIERDTNDPTYMESIYPFTELTDRDKEGRRYNLLPSDSNDDCYRIVGTFPSKRLVLDDNVQLEVFDKYYKFSTVTNNAGDYMLFGVPSGNQQIHVDIDLSDIGILSQTPRDFEYKGYSMTMFDSPTQFKESTNIDNLAQIYSQNNSVFVYPFWGDEDLGNGVAAITRADIQIQYKFEPTCVFMGAIISDNEANAIGHKCSPAEDNGMNSQLIAGEGTIEMIRRTPDGLVEEYSIQGNQLIDANGVWCYQIPMNLDFVGTDEYGNVVPTDNPSKGIPTRTQVRFRFSKNETGNEGHSRHTAKYLVPMNPTLVKGRGGGQEPCTLENGKYIEKMYEFGSNTPEDCFRDLYWNNVYSVKNYIPKTQVAHRSHAPNYTGLKGSNLVDDQNPVPFNKLRIDIPFMYAVVCIIFSILIIIVTIINFILSALHWIVNNVCIPLPSFLGGPICPFKILFSAIGFEFTCISLGAGLSDDNTAYYPGCSDDAMHDSSCPEDMENCKKRASTSALIDLVQQKLAGDYKIVKLDFYHDWLNGSLYMPLWYWRKSKKKTFLFWTISGAKNEFCDCNKTYGRLKTFVNCSPTYADFKLKLKSGNVPEGEDKWHRGNNQAARVFFPNGLIKGVENKDGLTAYYYVAIQPTGDAVDAIDGRGITEQPIGFKAMRLFATDIILLGNLNEDNLYGIPQFFKALPSTTANIPPIATIHDSNDEDDTKDSKNTLADTGDTTGPSMTTGMDWVGGGGTPPYSKGLFMDLACTYADTKAKSCINVERLSELGMNLDMEYDVSYPSSTGLKVGTFQTDGLITKYELDDIENRAMFATMNHVGFVPQTYQDKHSGYTTQIQDENTTYYVPKFKYLYPTDLDGRMEVIIDRYWDKQKFKQIMSDDADDAYINFRLGDVQHLIDNQGHIDNSNNVHNGDGLFYDKDGDQYRLPSYNNSFYFYFGVKKGNTAIEKFNKMFDSKCFKNSKYPFTLDIDKKGLSYCPTAYCNSGDGASYISFTSDDIETPYSYKLIDTRYGDVVSKDDELESATTIITINENSGTPLDNSSYLLTITDNNGRSISEKVRLEMPLISANIQATPLGKKYYEAYYENGEEIIPETSSGDITTYDYCGTIEISDIFIDSYRFGITDFSYSAITCPTDGNCLSDGGIKISESGGTYIKLELSGKNCDDKFCFGSPNSSSEKHHIANLYLQVTDDEGNVSGDTTAYLSASCPTVIVNSVDLRCTSGDTLVFKVWKPSVFNVTLSEICDGVEISANTSIQSVMVENGENFHAYLNNMPIDFMKENFYPPSAYTRNYEGDWIWLKVHDPKSYQTRDAKNHLHTFYPANDSYRAKWDDFVSIVGDIDDYNVKKKILVYEFGKIFDVSTATYVTGKGYNNTFRYTTTGGKQPILYRSVMPAYVDDEKVTNTIVYGDRNTASVNPVYPNIVGSNYQDNSKSNANSPRINLNYSSRYRDNLGNYFAAFTNNGGYTSDTKGDDCHTVIHIDSIPEAAPVNVRGGSWKILGEDTEIQTIPEGVYASGNNDTVCSSIETQPYFKSMFVDRRLDYDLAILAPFSKDKYEFVPDHGISAETIGECGVATIQDIRLCGYIYNGIEMAYDDDYNIIASGDSNNTLEYRYSIASSSTEEPCRGDGCVTIGYNPKPTTRRRFYEATVAGADIREAFWTSAYSASLDSQYEDVVRLNFDSIIPHTGWQHTDIVGCSADTSASASGITWNAYINNGLINSDFGNECKYYPKPNEEKIDKYSYPTKRYLDLKVSLTDNLPISIVSCGYNLGLDGGSEDFSPITATLNGDEILDLNIRFGTSVIPTPVNSKTLPSTTKQEVDYGHFIYNLRAISGEDVSLPCQYAAFLVDFKDLGQTDMETYIPCPKFIALEQIKKFKMGDYGTSVNELNDAWLALGDKFGNISQKDWEIGDKKDKSNSESYKIENRDGDKMILYDGIPLSIEGGLTKVCNATCIFANTSNDGDEDTYKKIYDILHDYILYTPTDGRISPSDMFTELDDNEHISDFVNSGYVALMYKKKVQTISNSNTVASNLKKKLTSYEFSELYYFGDIKCTWDVIFNLSLYLGYQTAKLNRFKAWNVNENKEIKGDVTINYEVNVRLSEATSEAKYVVTSTIGETVDIVEEFSPYFENTDIFGLMYYLTGKFAIYLTTENGIRYKFYYQMNH